MNPNSNNKIRLGEPEGFFNYAELADGTKDCGCCWKGPPNKPPRNKRMRMYDIFKIYDKYIPDMRKDNF